MFTCNVTSLLSIFDSSSTLFLPFPRFSLFTHKQKYIKVSEYDYIILFVRVIFHLIATVMWSVGMTSGNEAGQNTSERTSQHSFDETSVEGDGAAQGEASQAATALAARSDSQNDSLEDEESKI